MGERIVTDNDLIRFVNAQRQVNEQVVEELKAGRKLTHWMWFIFPQLVGLGRSATAQKYGIKDLDQAKRYLDDPVLGERLRHCTKLMVGHEGRSALDILGSPDDLKFRSCLTLFRETASGAADKQLFGAALDQFYKGEADQRTLDLLAARSGHSTH
jgi:uncharacterized protein (DUF1810 family)